MRKEIKQGMGVHSVCKPNPMMALFVFLVSVACSQTDNEKDVVPEKPETPDAILAPPKRLIVYKKAEHEYYYIHHHPGVTKQEHNSSNFESIGNEASFVVVYDLDKATGWEHLQNLPSLNYMENKEKVTYEVVISARAKSDLRVFRQTAWHPLYDVLFIEENPFPIVTPNKEISDSYRFILHAHSIDENGYLHFSLESKMKKGFFLSADNSIDYETSLTIREVGTEGTAPTFILVDLDISE